MQLKTALLGLIGTLGLACGEARAHVDPAPAAAAPSSDYKGIRQTSDAASPAERVPPRMKFVPGGSFEVGLSEDDVQALELENPALIKLFAASTPRHEVTLEPYYIGEFEVTNAEWKIFLDATEREPSKDLTENYWIDGEIPSGHEHHPVTFVSFPEVEEYCRWAMVRVPTEHEWTFAARGPDGAIFPWGNEFDEPIPQELQRRPRDAQEAEELEKARNALRRGGNMAWCADSSFKGSREPQRVGTMPAGASPFGLMDVVGNVWEWTSSSYTAYPDYEDIGIKTKASRGKKEKYTAAEYFNSSRRVLKGGAFDSPALALRTDVRQYEEQKAWNQTIGFRVAKSVRPGLDAIGYALGDVGSYQFHEKSAPLAMDAIQAVEVTHYDGEGRISGQQGIVFAPVSDWPKYAKSRESDRDSLKSPLSIGLLITSEPTVYPPLGPGTYTIAFQAQEKKWKAPDGFVETPSDDWTFHGWEEFDTTFKSKKKKQEKEAKRSRKSSKGEPAEGEKAEEGETEEPAEPTEEELDLEKYRFRANEGSVPYDHRRNHILILDAQNVVLAALPIDDPKELSKAVTTTLARANIGENTRKRLPKTERFLYTWSLAFKGARKHLKFELPLLFRPGAIQADTGTSKVDAEAASEER